MIDSLLENKRKGRKKIIIDGEVRPDTIFDIISKAWIVFQRNSVEINKLIDYFLGIQNVKYKGTPGASFYGNEIKNKTTINYASSTVRTIVGYSFSQGAQIVQRKGKHLKDIEKLVDIMNYENSETVDFEAGVMSSICGVSYLGLFPTKELYSDYMPEYPIVPMYLDPLSTFIICSPELGNPTKLSVAFYVSKELNKTIFYAYTDNERYTIECKGQGTFSPSTAKIIDYGRNPIGLNPILCVPNNKFMLGDFELAMEVSDALNLLASDSVSDVENVIKSLLVIMNAELTGDEAKKARKNRILQLIGSPGQSPDAKFIYQQLDAIGMQNLREYLEEAYKTIVGIPDRKTRGGGGGDTGDAVKLRDGWADIEIVARIKERYFKIAKKKQLAVAIKVLQLLGEVSQDFKLEDIDIKLPRNKHDNIQTKAQSFSTLLSTGEIAPVDALAMADITNDITGVVDRAKKYNNQKQKDNKNNFEDQDSKQEDKKNNESKNQEQ